MFYAFKREFMRNELKNNKEKKIAILKTQNLDSDKNPGLQ